MSTDATELPDLKRRELLVKATATVGGLAICGAAVPFLDSLRPSARATANAAPVDFDVSKLTPGALATVQWRGRPIWVLKPPTSPTTSRRNAALPPMTLRIGARSTGIPR